MRNDDSHTQADPGAQGCTGERGANQAGGMPPKHGNKRPRRRLGMLRLVVLLFLLGALLLLALSLGGGLGLGGGFESMGVAVQSGVSGLTEAAKDAVSRAEEPAAAAQSEAAPEAAPNPNEIVIRQDAVTYMGETLTTEQLRDALLQNYREGEITLVDDKAIKAAYDGVTALLSELAIPYKAG